MTSRQELVAAAMEELGTNVPRARRRTIAIAVKYRRMTDPRRGVYAASALFTDLHDAAKKERTKSLVLAHRVDALTKRMRALLPALGVADHHHVSHVIGERLELAERLRESADFLDSLEPNWPKGGPGNLADSYFGTAHEWLIRECAELFLAYGRFDQVKSTRGDSRFVEFIYVVYELATGQKGSKARGLDARIDKLVRKWRQAHKKRAKGLKFAETAGGVVYAVPPLKDD